MISIRGLTVPSNQRKASDDTVYLPLACLACVVPANLPATVPVAVLPTVPQ